MPNLISLVMIRKIYLVYTLVLIGIVSCTKKETQSLDLSGDITGKITTLLEYGPEVNDRANVAITLTGVNTLTSHTDSAGNYFIKNVPFGRYTVKISKDGYGTYTIQNFNFIGSNKPKDLSIFLRHKSTTKIVDYNLLLSGNKIRISGTITHSYPQSVMTSYPFFWPSMSIYISSSSNISNTNWLSSYFIHADQNVPTNFTDSLYFSYLSWPHGSTLYAIIYGCNILSSTIYDYETHNYYDPCLGEASTIKSIVIP